MTTQTANRFEALDSSEEAATERLLDQLAKAHGAEAHAAEIVAAECLLHRFIYAPALGWLEWDGVRWDDDPDASEKVVEVVRQFNITKEADYRAREGEATGAVAVIVRTIKGRLSEADKTSLLAGGGKPEDLVKQYGDDDERKAYADAVSDAQNAKKQADIWGNLLSLAKISNLVKLGRGMEGILVRTTDLDAHPDLLNCRNCVVNLRTGEEMPHEPTLLLTKVAGGDYTPGARSDIWDKALGAVHPDALGWLQERMGQSFSGHRPSDDSLVISAGGGENGKSAVMEAFLRAAGDYGDIIDHKVLLADPNQHSTEKMDLRGLRLAYMDETPEEGRLDTQRLKGVVGTAKIKARHMHKNTVTFEATHTMWINTNFLPQVDSTDHGTWRRLFAMPWPFRFRKPWEECTEENDRPGDMSLKGSLESHPDIPSAVLAWVVAGAVAHFARTEPARPPLPVEQASRDWRSRSDVGLQFAEEYLVAAPGHFIAAEAMFAEFTRFLETEGKRAWSKQTINTRLPASFDAAGIPLQKTPHDKPKVTARMTQSHAPLTADEDPWRASGPSRPVDIAPGKTARMWLGVRFRTVAERGQRLAEAV